MGSGNSKNLTKASKSSKATAKGQTAHQGASFKSIIERYEGIPVIQPDDSFPPFGNVQFAIEGDQGTYVMSADGKCIVRSKKIFGGAVISVVCCDTAAAKAEVEEEDWSLLHVSRWGNPTVSHSGRCIVTVPENFRDDTDHMGSVFLVVESPSSSSKYMTNVVSEADVLNASPDASVILHKGLRFSQPMSSQSQDPAELPGSPCRQSRSIGLCCFSGDGKFLFYIHNDHGHGSFDGVGDDGQPQDPASRLSDSALWCWSLDPEAGAPHLVSKSFFDLHLNHEERIHRLVSSSSGDLVGIDIRGDCAPGGRNDRILRLLSTAAARSKEGYCLSGEFLAATAVDDARWVIPEANTLLLVHTKLRYAYPGETGTVSVHLRRQPSSTVRLKDSPDQQRLCSSEWENDTVEASPWGFPCVALAYSQLAAHRYLVSAANDGSITIRSFHDLKVPLQTVRLRRDVAVCQLNFFAETASPSLLTITTKSHNLISLNHIELQDHFTLLFDGVPDALLPTDVKRRCFDLL